MKIFKVYLKYLQFLFPKMASRKIFHLISTPRVRKLREHEAHILDQAELTSIPFQGFKIQNYRWGSHLKKVAFLVHGWEGQAGNFAALVPVLLEKGYQVIAFDAPNHGRSSKGKANMFDFRKLVLQQYKIYQPDLIISHSFGSVTTAALFVKNPELSLAHWLIVTTPIKYLDFLEQVFSFLEVFPRIQEKVIQQVEAQLEEPIEQLNIAHYCQQIQNIDQVTIVHSKADRVLPIEGSRLAHQQFPQSKLYELEDLGHYSILWSDQLQEILRARLN